MPSPTPQLALNRQPGRNQCYDEALADRVLPLRMMQIPAGTFLMGSPADELERLESEGPQREVTLAQFFMGKYPITQAQWRAVAALPQVERELQANPSGFEGDLRPVEQVSWHDAGEFCDRLTILTNRQYRLPTEAEWEYACRANPIRTVGTPEVWQVKLSEQLTPFHFGETISSELANYDARTAYRDGPKGEYRGETTPVNQFEGANAFGLCDMHGNVLEWCQDYWHSNYKGAPTNGSAWIKGGNSERRVLRGGSWYYAPWDCRSAYRYSYGPFYRVNFIGFRVVCSAPRAL